MDIVLSWDRSVTALPSGEQAAFEAAVTYAADYWDTTLTNNLTIDINVGWGEITQSGQRTTLASGTSEGGPDDGSTYSYAQVRAALQAHENSPATASAFGALPASDPTSGMGITVPVLEAEALGLPPDNGGATASGSIGFGASSDYNFSTTDRAIPNEADFVGVALHEISHALGRISNAGANQPATVLDLFRFTAPGVEDPSAGDGSYFSVNNGATALEDWAAPSTDPGDWSDNGPFASINDAFDASYGVGVENSVTSTDLKVMNVLGFALASTTTAASDFNGDGLSDILWRNTNGDTGAWLTISAGGYTSVDFGVVDSSWAIQGVGDFNRDGKADILWRNTNGQVGWWLSNAGTGYAGFTRVILGSVASSWVIQGVDDFNGDGLSDILWRNTNGDTGAWLTTAAGGYTSVDFGVIDQSWTIQGVGDFNGDGKAGILWRNTNGQVGWWLSNSGTGYAGFTRVTLASVASSWVVQGVGAFDGSGLSDILWRNTNGDTGVWLTNAGGGYSAVDFGVVDPSWTIQGVGDYNGDGKADILWRNSNGEVGWWLSNSGSGYTGFTKVVLASVDNSWRIVDTGTPAATAGSGAAMFAHAMAAMTTPHSLAMATPVAIQSSRLLVLATPMDGAHQA